MTDIKLELITDVDIFQFIEKGMSGGASYIANRYGKANNKYMLWYWKLIWNTHKSYMIFIMIILYHQKNKSNKKDVIPILPINKRKIQYQHRSSTLRTVKAWVKT